MKKCTSGFLVLTTLLFGPDGWAQTPVKVPPQEQTLFSIELDFLPVVRPVELPRAALQTLASDERVRSCLAMEGMPPEELPANWFVGSEIRLKGPNSDGLVVLPGHTTCLIGANTAQVFVLRKTPFGYELVLSTISLGLKVLPTRTNGFRDIETGVAAGGYSYAYHYRFDGRIYRIARQSSGPIGEERPGNLTGYETRKPLAQQRGQPSGPVLAEARAWIWKRWQAQKLSYLKVRTFDADKDETCTYFINQSKTGDWQLTIEVHRVVWEQDSTTQLRRKVLVDELSVASHVQRIAIPKDETDSPLVLPQTDELPATMYRLQFLDHAKRPVGTL